MGTRVAFGIALAVGAVAIVVAAMLFDDQEEGPQALVCPATRSAHVFADARRLCATRATALAQIDGEGRVNNFIEPGALPCRPPSYMVVNENTTSVVGHGSIRCDIDDTGRGAFVFHHCSLTMNYPGNEDYRASLPIGLLVEPYDC